MTTVDHGELIQQINHLVAEEVLKNPVTYNREKPYQSYERIGYQARRWSVEKRIAEYGLDKLCDSNSRVLDIGSNFGFFVVEFGLRCKLAHGVEPNPTLIQIGKLTAEYLDVADRVEFFDTTFEEFESNIRYDLVLSFSCFVTSDRRQRGGADYYFSKVNRLLADEGHLVYESGSYTKDSAMWKYPAGIEAIEGISRHFNILDQWETP